MRLLDQYFAAVLFSCLLDSAHLAEARPPETQLSASYNQLLQRHNYSNMVSSDVTSWLSALGQDSSLRVVLIYDSLHIDDVYSITALPENLEGITRFEYDVAFSVMDQMISVASGTTLFLLICSPVYAVSIFQKISELKLKSYMASWLLAMRTEEEIAVALPILEKALQEGTQVTFIARDSSGSHRISSIRSEPTRTMRISKSINKDSQDKERFQHLVIADSDNLYSDMRGKELRLAARNHIPFTIVGEEGADGSVHQFSGVDFVIAETLSSVLNFTFRVVKPPDGLWGGVMANGTATGLIGMVARDDVNFAVSGIGIISNREQVLDFTYPYYQDSLALLSRAPQKLNSSFAVFHPFTLTVWFCIVISTLAMGPVLAIQSKISGALFGTGAKLDLQMHTFNVFRSLVVQGILLPVRNLYLRLLLVFWYIFCIIVVALYSGTLTAVLAIPSYEKPIDSLTDLPSAVADGFILATVRQSFVVYLLQEAKQGIYKDTWKLFNHRDLSKSLFGTPIEAYGKILEDKYVVISTATSGRSMTAQMGIDRYYIGRQLFYPINFGIACPTHTPFKEKLNQVLPGMIEGGLISKWKDDQVNLISKRTSGVESTTPPAISLTHLQGAFFLLVLGYAIGLMVLMTEKLLTDFMVLQSSN